MCQLWNRIKVMQPLGPDLMLSFVGRNCRRICRRQNPLVWQNRFHDLYDCCEEKRDLSHSMHKIEHLAGTPVGGRLQNKLSI